LRRGGWHVNHALSIIDAHGRDLRFVLRRWARPGWQVDDPDYTVEREVHVLAVLEPTPVPAPLVVAADPAGAYCDVPAILLSHLPGHPPQAKDTESLNLGDQLAETLAQIHALPGAATARLDPVRLYFDRAHATLPRWIPATPTWRHAITALRQPPPTSATTMLHRDYHQDNTLWSRGHLSGVVDWTQACWGPPQLDVGHMRWNLVADHGLPAADRFLARYQAMSGASLPDQPYWDLVALFDLLLTGDDPGDITPRRPTALRRLREGRTQPVHIRPRLDRACCVPG
jgi:aminoglycoside phosphotransferase (APT) family kinase protein